MAKRALREGHSIHALLELNAIIEEQPENWLAYCLRARVNAALERYLEAISDCTHVLQQPKSVNRRNRIQLLERISSYADKLCRIQKAQLDRTFRKDFGVSSQKTVAGLPSTGRIGQIGKFILDPNDIAKISHLVLDKVTAQSTVRRLTQEAAESLNKLLRQIGEQPGVLGSCVICRDGFLYVSTFPNSFDLDSLGICSLGAYINAINIGKKIGYHPVKQIILRNGKSLVLILDIGLGLLVTVAGNLNRSELVGLVEAINEITSTK
jgi:predicted regulator of Ras-like GTPase activity (Roadblock/LC7/MglB family)